jgi:hypothetical protein
MRVMVWRRDGSEWSDTAELRAVRGPNTLDKLVLRLARVRGVWRVKVRVWCSKCSAEEQARIKAVGYSSLPDSVGPGPFVYWCNDCGELHFRDCDRQCSGLAARSVPLPDVERVA